MNQFVYLAGPVLGQTEGQANDWRREIADKLRPHGIIGISPLRCEPLHGLTYQAGYPDERFGTARAILNKNFMDVQKADMVLANIPKVDMRSWRMSGFLGEPPHHSWGTMGEFHWSFALRKPVILVTDDPSIREHPVINAAAGWVLDNLDDAVDTIVGMLSGYAGGKSV